MSENNNKDIEIIAFDEVINICSDYLLKLADEESSKKFEELKSRLVVRDFLGIQQKEIIFKEVLVDLSLDWAVETLTSEVELAAFFNGLLAYTNIDLNYNRAYKIPEVYNIIYYTGLADYILSFCEKDYNKTVAMIDRMIQFENVEHLIDTIQDVNGERLENLNKQFEKFTMDNNLDVLTKLSDVLAHNDPLLTTIKENIESSAYKELKKQENPKE